MRQVEREWLSSCLMVVLGVVAAGCGGDDEDKGKPCPKGVMAGQTTDCTCDDGTMSEATCQEDKTLTACDCPDGGTGSGAGAGGAGAGSTAGTGAGGKGGAGGSAPTAGSGGAGGASTDADGGMPPAGDAGAEPPPDPIKMDGTLLALCEDGTQCGFELDCYGAATGGGFCSTQCTEDTECEEVGPAFTCGSGGLCRQSCMGTDDDSCPEQMSCLMTGGFQGGGGGATFACAYGESGGQPPADAFAECMGDQGCDGDAICVGDTMMDPGYCSVGCMNDMGCEGLEVPSGNLEPTCEFSGGGGGQISVCALNCDDADAECPEGMVCRESMGPLPSVCVYE